MARRLPRTISLELTTVQDAPVAYSDAPLWVVDGIFVITTAALQVSGRTNPDAFTTFTVGTSFGWRFVGLHELLVGTAAAGVNGTLTFTGTVVETEEELIAILYAGG